MSKATAHWHRRKPMFRKQGLQSRAAEKCRKSKHLNPGALPFECDDGIHGGLLMTCPACVKPRRSGPIAPPAARAVGRGSVGDRAVSKGLPGCIRHLHVTQQLSAVTGIPRPFSMALRRILRQMWHDWRVLVPSKPAASGRGVPAAHHLRQTHFFTGIGVLRGTGTAVTLFCGEPSITRSA